MKRTAGQLPAQGVVIIQGTATVGGGPGADRVPVGQFVKDYVLEFSLLCAFHGQGSKRQAVALLRYRKLNTVTFLNCPCPFSRGS